MRKALVRCFWFAVAALFAMSLLTAVAEELSAAEPVRIPKFYWFMQYDRTPNAFSERFNSLAQEWTDIGKLKQFAEVPSLDDARPNGSDGFYFAGNGKNLMMHTNCLDYSIAGTMGADGKIKSLSVLATPTGEPDYQYAVAADSLVHLSMNSLFDELTERSSTHLTLFLRYDVRPFNQHSALSAGKRTGNSVVKGDKLSVTWEVTPDGTFKVDAQIQTGSTDEELQLARDNNQVNRTLSTATTECGTLLDYVREMKRLVSSDTVRWADLRDVLSQIQECIISANEYADTLLDYPKSHEYALKLKASLRDVTAEAEQLSALVQSADTYGLDEFLTSVTEHVLDMYHLIFIIRAA